MRKLLIFVLALSAQVAAHAADGFSTLEERMTGKEFKETGLVKLTDAELSALNQWLRRHSVATLSNATAPQATVILGDGMVPLTTDDQRGFGGYTGPGSKGDDDNKVIRGTILGTFSGWDGKGTQFKLTNGMIWEQTEKDSFAVSPIQNAEIEITKSSLGNWKLSVAGQDKDVRVRRIR